jgi:hypothetical protein
MPVDFVRATTADCDKASMEILIMAGTTGQSKGFGR